MIREIWLRIAALLALAVLPIMVLQLKLQQDSIALVYDIADRTGIRASLDEFLTQLREDARAMPEKEKEFKTKFLSASGTKRSLEEFFLAQSSIDKDIRFQTVGITFIVLLLSLLGSVGISRGIVKRVKALIEERERASAKLRDFNALQNWQGVAKILVHELRAPITPIKLVATDLDYKYKTLSAEQFSNYLRDAQALVNEQVEAIESMIEGFTVFGKLPDPDLRLHSITSFLEDFKTNYGRSFGEGVTIDVDLPQTPIMVLMDPKLLRDLIFNICKNACEANAARTAIRLSLALSQRSIVLSLHNTGLPIPDSIRRSLFDPYVSTKSGSNMGLGLAISRKIAFDHGGDLTLLESGPGVTFQLELPHAALKG